jgi:Kef-type K+ transport system membrane component KefB
MLFFQVGLDSTVADMKKIRGRAFLVAVCGIAGSVLCGWAVARVLLPQTSASAQIFLAASLAATSVGVTARVLKDLGRARSATAHVILGAAVADDIVSLLVLAVIGASGVMTFRLQPAAFVAIAAFAAGILIDDRRSHEIDARLAPYARWIVPVFFVVIGIRADLAGLAKPAVLGLAAALTAAAVLGKLCCAIGLAGAHTTRVDPVAVGIGMMPRGEVTLVFATAGLPPDTFLAVVLVVIATTLMTPIALKWRLAARQ